MSQVRILLGELFALLSLIYAVLPLLLVSLKKQNMKEVIGSAISVVAIRKEMKQFISAEKAAFLPYFFKTGAGQYAEGDCFLGIVVPKIRLCASKFKQAPPAVLIELLLSKFHEERMLALIIMVEGYKKGTPAQRQLIYDLYVEQIARVNNWDLVDISAPNLVGAHLYASSREPLYQWVKQPSIWLRRIAIVATLYFVRQNDHKDTLKLAELLLHDPHDLLHKATGWLLREVGKRNKPALVAFLKQYASKMPRTMLRYSIEHFSPAERKLHLNAKAQALSRSTEKIS